MGQATKDEICDFVNQACQSNTNRELYLFTIDVAIAQKIKAYIPLTLSDYDVIIT
jgi:hypothetical protein